MAVVNDCIIDYKKLNEDTDGEVVVGPPAQRYKQQFSHEGQAQGTKFESHCERCGESLWKCLSA